MNEVYFLGIQTKGSVNIVRIQRYCNQGLKNWKYRPIFRVSAHLDTIFPSDCRSGEISAFYRFFRRNFGDISGFYRFFRYFPKYRLLFMNRYCSLMFINRLLFITMHKMENLLLTGFEPCPKVQGSNLLSTRLKMSL